MALLTILDVNQPSLRGKCHKVSRVTPAEKKLLEDMVETMRTSRGIGLAAPQVGVLQRLIVVEVEDDLYALANPEIVDLSDETEIMEEGCLSLPNYYGPVERPSRATVRAQDKNGKKLKIKAEGLLARVLQHEIDHLDGILFFDPLRMRSLNDLHYSPPKAEGEEEGEGDRHAFKSERTEHEDLVTAPRLTDDTRPIGEGSPPPAGEPVEEMPPASM